MANEEFTTITIQFRDKINTRSQQDLDDAIYALQVLKTVLNSDAEVLPVVLDPNDDVLAIVSVS